jgi:hypothetical protein
MKYAQVEGQHRQNKQVEKQPEFPINHFLSFALKMPAGMSARRIALILSTRSDSIEVQKIAQPTAFFATLAIAAIIVIVIVIAALVVARLLIVWFVRARLIRSRGRGRHGLGLGVLPLPALD